MPHLTVATGRDPGNVTNFLVTVMDERHHKLVELDALSAAHARRVAADVLCLLQRLEPGRRVVLEIEAAPARN